MSRACELTEDAEQDLANSPNRSEARGARAHTYGSGPFQGDVKALHGEEWKGVFRIRMGDYRLLFVANHEMRTVSVLRVLLRSGKTYR
jgi:mRNA-degrading endonuclease RelE of RelBE toxin-antitoxin system